MDKTSINLSRNSPVALVVGAAGFLGSHIVDKLLEKNLQVVGVDNFKSSDRTNLDEAIKDKNFHFLNIDASKLELDLDRLDYIFIASSENWDIEPVLDLFKSKRARCLFISWIDLYDSKSIGDFSWFKQNESKLARFASDHHLNARILRLGPIFGPRMHFKVNDPLIRLIQAHLNGDLQKDISLEFSSRALYILDACDLIIKCMFAGSTAQKIFDGVLIHPIKVSEIKQVLLDPNWFEQRGFKEELLPSWSTPNLEKTVKILNWKPKIGLVESLKQTINYFKDHDISVPELEVRSLKTEDGEKGTGKKEEFGWKAEKREELEKFKEVVKGESRAKKGRRIKFHFSLSRIYLFLAILIISYGLIWPVLAVGWGVLSFRYQLSGAVEDLSKGEFEESLYKIEQAEEGANQAEVIFTSLHLLRSVSFLEDLFRSGDNLANLANLSTSSAKSTILGIQNLYKGLEAVTGELNEDPAAYFDRASIELAKADQSLSLAEAFLKNEDFKSSVPAVLKARVDSLEQKLSVYSELIKKGRALVSILPPVVGLNSAEQKSYLVLLQNNMELRPTGGFIGSFAQISFEGGKLKKIEVNDVYAIDGQLSVHVEPPKEIKEDLGQNNWYLRDSNWEPDFPTSARQASWFYTRETGQKVVGVLALDISAMENLLEVLGSLDLPDYNIKVGADNLFSEAVTHAETGFFPGSQAKKSFLTSLTNGLLNKIFFLPRPNWPAIVSALGQSLEEKHMSVYLDDPKLFSYVVSQNWAGAIPRQSEVQTGRFQDFLSLVEANLGANKANYYLDRSYKLETVISKDGEVGQRLRVSYTNRSPSLTFPAGAYKNRLRVYLPFGTRMNRVLFGEKDITTSVSSFVDYGRTGYSVLLELAPKEQKTLVLDYQLPSKLEFIEGKSTYRLDVVKQAGLGADPFEWSITYPINYQIDSQKAKAISPQEQTIQTDLSKDRSFEVTFTK